MCMHVPLSSLLRKESMSPRVIPMAAAAVRYGTLDMAFEWEPQPAAKGRSSEIHYR